MGCVNVHSKDSELNYSGVSEALFRTKQPYLELKFVTYSQKKSFIADGRLGFKYASGKAVTLYVMDITQSKSMMLLEIKLSQIILVTFTYF